MIELNKSLFLLLNAPANAFATTVMLADFAASEVIVLVPIVLAGLWIWGHPTGRSRLIATAISTALALAANQLVGLLWYEPRPFMAGVGRTLMAHVPENSFPSDHMTFMISVGSGLIVTRAAPLWGKIVILLGLLVAWARVYLGLHFPIDMLASGAIGGLFGASAVLWRPVADRCIMPWVEPLYESMLRLLRLPAWAFPRSPNA